jgi:hypothetical protein
MSNEHKEAAIEAAQSTGKLLFISTREARDEMQEALNKTGFLSRFASLDNVDRDQLLDLCKAAAILAKNGAALGITADMTEALTTGQLLDIDPEAEGFAAMSGLAPKGERPN